MYELLWDWVGQDNYSTGEALCIEELYFSRKHWFETKQSETNQHTQKNI